MGILFPVFAVVNKVLRDTPLHTFCMLDISLFEGSISRTVVAGFTGYVRFSVLIRNLIFFKYIFQVILSIKEC